MNVIFLTIIRQSVIGIFQVQGIRRQIIFLINFLSQVFLHLELVRTDGQHHLDVPPVAPLLHLGDDPGALPPFAFKFDPFLFVKHPTAVFFDFQESFVRETSQVGLSGFAHLLSLAEAIPVPEIFFLDQLIKPEMSKLAVSPELLGQVVWFGNETTEEYIKPASPQIVHEEPHQNQVRLKAVTEFLENMPKISWADGFHPGIDNLNFSPTQGSESILQDIMIILLFIPEADRERITQPQDAKNILWLLKDLLSQIPPAGEI